MNAHAPIFTFTSQNGFATHLRLRNHKRVAHRNKLARLLRRHYTRHACARQNIAFRRRARRNKLESFGLHRNKAFRNGNALGVGLLRNVHHADVALLINMRKLLFRHIAFLQTNGSKGHSL